MAIRKSVRKTQRQTTPKPKARAGTIWERIAALGETIPPEELAHFRRDGARNLDHYLYGAPKR